MSPAKSEYFNFIVYPASAPDDWHEQLKRSHCPYAISPLHEPDEEHHKPHYHVMYKADGPITLHNAYSKIPDSVPCNGHIEVAKSARGSMRYLLHLDDPDKQQFEGGAGAIEVLNGFPLDLRRALSQGDKVIIRNEIIDLIRDNNIIEYSDLVYHLLDTGNPDNLDYACNHTIFFNNLISSLRHRNA